MQQVVNELLNVVDQPPEFTRAILEQNTEFLLEPLEDNQAVLDPDSIYTSGMTRNERYDTYEKSMQERLDSAKKPSVKKVLTALKDFVLSFRDTKTSSW